MIRARNKFLQTLGGKHEIKGLNSASNWETGSYDTILFHWIMKNPLRQIIKAMPGIPQAWIDNLTGPSKTFYEIGKHVWYDSDHNAERREKMWKPFQYFCVLWDVDDMAEFCDRILFECLSHPERFFISVPRLDPENWYIDGRGRRVKVWSYDPRVRFDYLFPDSSIIVESKPSRDFIYLIDRVGDPYYAILDLQSCSPVKEGGYSYNIVKKTPHLINARLKRGEISNGD
jgi:hypothetical protein